MIESNGRMGQSTGGRSVRRSLIALVLGISAGWIVHAHATTCQRFETLGLAVTSAMIDGTPAPATASQGSITADVVGVAEAKVYDPDSGMFRILTLRVKQ